MREFTFLEFTNMNLALGVQSQVRINTNVIIMLLVQDVTTFQIFRLKFLARAAALETIVLQNFDLDDVFFSRLRNRLILVKVYDKIDLCLSGWI